MISRVRGTRDIVDGTTMKYICTALQNHLETYNYQQIYLPLIEQLALFKRAIGDETDVVSKEMFLVNASSAQNTQDSQEICLRPEATASTVRAFIENGITTKPWKVFTIGEMFRYERPQKGRFRQFYQCSIESIGTDSVTGDALFIFMLNQFFSKTCQILEYALHINYLGCPEDRITLKKTLDTFLTQHLDQLCATCVKRKETNILRVFDCKNETCKTIYKNAPTITFVLCATCDQEWNLLKNSLDDLAITYTHNTHLVRGLDYYNKTVFEFVSPLLGAQSAFAGGGRYDGLVSAIGGKQDQPSIGAAIGLDRLMILFEELNKDVTQHTKPLYLILPFGPEQHTMALHIASMLYAQNFCSDIVFEKSIKNMLKIANSLGAKYCLLIGSEEMQTNSVKIKNMITGNEESVKQSDIISFLKQ